MQDVVLFINTIVLLVLHLRAFLYFCRSDISNITLLNGFIMFRKLVLLSTLLLTSVSTQAALISHFGYERDSASNIVIGGGLEWLKWDVTEGMSISSALSSYASQGWRLASNYEMASLFNRFSFGATDWSADEKVNKNASLPWNSGDEFSTHAAFIRLFGSTAQWSCLGAQEHCPTVEDSMHISTALFGDDANRNGYYNRADVGDDYLHYFNNGRYTTFDHWASMGADHYWLASMNMDSVGVALVRTHVPNNAAVPTPGTIGLLALGLVALGYRRHVLGR